MSDWIVFILGIAAVVGGIVLGAIGLLTAAKTNGGAGDVLSPLALLAVGAFFIWSGS